MKFVHNSQIPTCSYEGPNPQIDAPWEWEHRPDGALIQNISNPQVNTFLSSQPPREATRSFTNHSAYHEHPQTSLPWSEQLSPPPMSFCGPGNGVWMGSQPPNDMFVFTASTVGLDLGPVFHPIPAAIPNDRAWPRVPINASMSLKSVSNRQRRPSRSPRKTKKQIDDALPARLRHLGDRHRALVADNNALRHECMTLQMALLSVQQNHSLAAKPEHSQLVSSLVSWPLPRPDIRKLHEPLPTGYSQKQFERESQVLASVEDFQAREATSAGSSALVWYSGRPATEARSPNYLACNASSTAPFDMTTMRVAVQDLQNLPTQPPTRTIDHNLVQQLDYSQGLVQQTSFGQNLLPSVMQGNQYVPPAWQHSPQG